MKKSLIGFLHLGFWFCYFLIIGVILLVYGRGGGEDADKVSNAFQTLLLFAVFPSLLVYVIYYAWLFPFYLKRKHLVLSICVGLLISLAASFLGYVLLRYAIETGSITDMDNGGRYGRSTAIEVILTMTFISTICGAVALVIKGFVTWINEYKLREALQEQNHAMEMALIKSQLDPHLLFNTINNIDSLILKDAIIASEYLNKLSDIMRFVLYETKADRIPLVKELEYIQKYIDLQKIRTANANYVHLEIIGSATGKVIAPMILIPFIENAFKHTNNKKLENAIVIKIRMENEIIQLICENKYEAKVTAGIPGGLGNQLIQKRLALIYSNHHTLEIQNHTDLYRVNLIIRHG